VLNAFFLFAVFPGPSQWLYAPGNVAALASMMLGIYLAQKLVSSLVPKEKAISKGKLIVASTIFAMIVRIPIMVVVMFAILRYGYLAPDAYTFAVLPVNALYSLVMALYTIPTAYLIAVAVNKNLKVGNQI
jgi:hypothetical protein